MNSLCHHCHRTNSPSSVVVGEQEFQPATELSPAHIMMNKHGPHKDFPASIECDKTETDKTIKAGQYTKGSKK